MKRLICFGMFAAVWIVAAHVDASGGGGVDRPLSIEGGKELGNGMKCTFNSDCASRNCTQKVCKGKGSAAKQLTNGAPCKFGSECESGQCTFKVCKAKGGGSGKGYGNGVACKFPSDCASKNCVFKVCKR